MKKYFGLSAVAALLIVSGSSLLAETSIIDTVTFKGLSNEEAEKLREDLLLQQSINEENKEMDSVNIIEPDTINGTTTYDGTGAGTKDYYNVHIGYYAGTSSTGKWNTFLGAYSGKFASSGYRNLAAGYLSGAGVQTGHDNVCLGAYVSTFNTAGSENTLIGAYSGNNSHGSSNTFVGKDSGKTANGSSNTFVGKGSGVKSSAGSNVFIGVNSGAATTSGGNNAFLGTNSGIKNTTGESNTFVGQQSGYQNTTGTRNTYVGLRSGNNNQIGNNNVCLGADAGYFETGSEKLYIDNSNTNKPLIYGEFDNDLLRINGSFEVNGTIENNNTITSIWAGSNTVDDGLTNLLLLSANNDDSGKVSDAGFGLRNDKANFQWNFRTGENGEAFIATKAGNGGADFQVLSAASYKDAEVQFGGVTVFKNGHLVNKSGVEITSLIDEQGEKLAMMEARDIAMEAALKAKDAEIIALKADAKIQNQKIAQLETMQQKVAMMESILTNLALETSNTEKEKFSLNK